MNWRLLLCLINRHARRVRVSPPVDMVQPLKAGEHLFQCPICKRGEVRRKVYERKDRP
jgi:hypothetical protein